MRGAVTTDGREPILPIEVSSSGKRAPRVEALVDTGFDGELTLRPATVESLGLPLIGVIESELADGSVVEEPVCDALVVWHGRERRIRAVVADARPLVGMALLGGQRAPGQGRRWRRGRSRGVARLGVPPRGRPGSK